MSTSSARKGLSKSSMDYSTGGDSGRPTPSPQRQNPYFYVGIVMDDADNQRMGRLMVYIPKQSLKRFANHSTPDYGGTVPDRETGRLDVDAELRGGWIPCYPLLPFAGTDFHRVDNSPDGRNARETGNSNSYGLWFQPRIGDHVGVLFDHADPGHGFWIGCLPRPFSNFSMPGVSGVQKSTLSEQLNSQFFEQLPDDALAPSMDKINEDGSGQRFTETFAPTEFTNNLLDAGLISDPLRGASVSSARRESPSYVVGLKSPGWDFNSEKNNFNVETGEKFDGTPVGERPSTSANSKYKNISTVGHQFVMDDHPEYQGVRLRTSAGSQLYFNDRSAAEPFIYIQTAKGNVWMEFRDDGKIDVYAKDDISFHAEGDINFVADGNMSVEVGGNYRTRVKGNQELQVAGTSAWEMNQAFSIKAFQSMNIDVIGSFYQNSSNETSFGAAGGNFYIAPDGTMNFKTSGGIILDGTGVDISSSTSINMQASSEIGLNGGGAVRASAGFIYLNSGAGLPPMPATSGPGPTTISLSGSDMLDGSPNPEQIRTGATPAPVESIASRLPQHQPWGGRSADTRGFNGFVEEASEDPLAPIHSGAAREDADRPVNQKGYINGNTTAKVYKGRLYKTSSFVEQPEFDEIRDPLPGELEDVNELSASDRLVKYLHTKEGLVTRTAYLDAGVAWAIGYGHNIKIGDRINGTLAFNGKSESREFRVDSDFISVLNRSSGTALSITEAEANRIFRVDLQKFEAAVRRNVQVDISQGQFDALVSITYNIGEGNMKKSTFLSKINSRNFQDVPVAWLLWRKSRKNGVLQVNEGLQKRRQEEIELFWAATDSDVLTA